MWKACIVVATDKVLTILTAHVGAIARWEVTVSISRETLPELLLPLLPHRSVTTLGVTDATPAVMVFQTRALRVNVRLNTPSHYYSTTLFASALSDYTQSSSDVCLTQGLSHGDQKHDLFIPTGSPRQQRSARFLSQEVETIRLCEAVLPEIGLLNTPCQEKVPRQCQARSGHKKTMNRIRYQLCRAVANLCVPQCAIHRPQ
jgi:hypothetical protein